MVASRYFESFIALMIIMNSIFIGQQVSYSMDRSRDVYENNIGGQVSDISVPTAAVVMEICFNVIFIAELLLRVIASGIRFVIGPEWKWNVFDMTLVLLSVVEMVILSFNDSVTLLRAVRLLRIARTIRMLRLFRFATFCHNLRLMSLAIVKSAVPLTGAVITLMIMIFMFSVVFVQAASDYIRDANSDDSHVPVLLEHFSSIPMAVLSLFMSISGGVDWWLLAHALLQISVHYCLLFVVFELVSVLAVLNIITGIFVNDALEMARMDRDMLTQLEKEDSKKFLAQLTNVFHVIDRQGTGTISLAEFTAAMNDEDLRITLAVLELTVHDAESFFKVLDIDQTNTVDIEKFIVGCMRLRGKAGNIPLELMIQEVKLFQKSMVTKIKSKMDRIESALERLCMHFEVRATGGLSADRSSYASQEQFLRWARSI